MIRPQAQVRIYIPGSDSLKAFKTFYNGSWEGMTGYIFKNGVTDPLTAVTYGPAFIVSVNPVKEDE